MAPVQETISILSKTVELSEWKSTNKHDLVYGGGKVGLMGVMADTIIEDGGHTIGVQVTTRDSFCPLITYSDQSKFGPLGTMPLGLMVLWLP